MRYLLIYCFAVFASFGCLKAKADETISFEGSQFSHFKNVGPFNFEIIESGGTPSPNTGPANGANGTNGYVYLEASNGAAYTAGDQAILLAENIDAESIEFYYHMFGDHIGSLSLQAKKNGIWETITLLEGPQQYSDTASWKFSSVSLADFPKPLNIRFVATAAGDYKGDIALDQITFKQNNTPSSTIIANFEDNLGVFSNQTPFLVSRYHGNTPTIDTGPSSGANGTQTYAFLETSAGAANSAGDTGILEANVTGTKLSFYFYMFGWQMGTLKVKALINGQWQVLWEKSGEEQVSPNEPWHKVYLKSEPYTAIRFEFIANGGYLGDMAIDEVVFDPPEFGDLTNDLEGGINWKDEGDHYWLRQAGSAPSSGTGPSSAHQGEYYALFETSLGAAFEAGDTAILKSPELNNEEEICFWFYMFGTDVGTLSLEYTKDNSNWLNLFQISGQQHFTKSSNWTNACASIPENTKYLRYKAIANGGYKGDIAIDNITVNNSDNNNVNLNTNYIGYYEGDDKQVTLSTETINDVTAVHYMGNDGEWKTATYNGNNKWLLDFNNFDSSTNVQIKLELGDGSVFYYSSLIEIEYLGKNRPEEAFSKTTEAIPDNSTFSSALAPSFDNTGALKGQASVSGGAATYHIPIELPPGRAGMQPNVSLNYSSRSGNGIAGVGWSLSAGSSITRCAATFAQDGFTQKPQYNSNDRLCLDGQRLIATSGSYGNSGTQYRTEIDSFVRVTQNGSLNGSSTWFKVEYKNGRVGYFGKEAKSRLVHGGKTAAYSWLIQYQHDATESNFINYEYSDFGVGEKLLTDIYYTKSSAEISSSGDRMISFIYQSSYKSGFGYVWGGKYESTQHLARIDIIPDDSTESVEKSYHLIYDEYYLNRLELCKSSICNMTNQLAATDFAWNKEELSFSNTDDHPYANVAIEPTDMVLASGLFYDTSSDYTGDGLNDIKMLEQVQEIAGNQTTFDITSFPDYSQFNNGAVNVHKISGYIDYNLNGIADFVYLDSNLNLSIVELNRDTGAYEDVFTTNIPAACDLVIVNDDRYNPMSEPCNSFAQDMNSDGYADFIIQDRANGQLKVYLRNTDASGKPISGFTYIGNVSGGGTKFGIADINGDGTPDVYNQEYGAWKELHVNGGTLGSVTHNLGINPDFHPVRTGKETIWLDVNGDNLLDVMTLKEVGSTNKLYWFMHLNLGGGQFSTGANTGLPEFNIWADSRENLGEEPVINSFVQVFDYDNDGRMDILAPYRRAYAYHCWDATNKQVCLIRDEDTGERIYYHKYDVWTWRVLKPNENGLTFEEIILQADGEDLLGGLATTSIVDVNGDGWQEIVTALGFRQHSSDEPCGVQIPYSSGRFYCYPDAAPEAGIYAYALEGGASRTLKRIDNDFGFVAEYEYQQLGRDANLSTGIYSVNNAPLADETLRKLGSSQKVVAKFKQPNGLGGTRSKQYHYIDGVYQNQGRGFMGFKSIIEEDVTKGIITQSDFNQVFPYQGKLTRQATFASEDFGAYDLLGSAAAETDALSYQEIIWKDNPNHSVAGVYSIYPKTTKIITRLPSTSESSSNSYSKTKVSTQTVKVNSIDKYGNVKEKVTQITDSWGVNKTTEVMSYDYDESSWFIDKLTAKTVTKHALTNRNSQDPITSTTELDPTTKVVTNLTNYHVNRKPRNITVSGLRGTSTSGKGTTTVITYNDYGLPTQVSATAQVLNSSGSWVNQTRTTKTAYSKDGNTVAVDGYFPYELKNAKNHLSYTHVNPATGKVTKTRQQLSGSSYLTTDYTYDDYNRPFSSQTDGQPVVYTAVQFPDAQAPTNAVLQVVSVSAGQPTQKVYQDKLGRVLRTAVEDFNGDWVFTDVEYNDLGYKTFESIPYKEGNAAYGVSYTSYDILGRLTEKVTNQHCGDMKTTYVYAGLRTDITASEDCEGKTIDMSRTYNSLKQLMETVDANNGVTRYSYNTLGLPMVIQDANGNNIIAKYNALGRKTQVNDPNQGVTNFEYNGFGELQREARVDSQTLTFITDVLGRVTRRTAEGEDTLNYTYDGAAYGLGQLNQATGNGVTKSFSFDSHGRAATQTIAGSGKTYKTTTFYDANYGRVKGLRYPNNLTISYDYTNSGYLQSIKNTASGYIYKTVIDQDVFGNITAADLGNGTSETSTFSSRNGQMLLKAVNKASNNLMNISYQSYDGFGNLKQVDVITGNEGIDLHQFTETYDYDNLHRLERNYVDDYEVTSYSYDAIGNLLSKSDYATQYDYTTGSTGGPNAVKRVYRNGWKSFSYDTRGNMTSGDGLTSATYNAMDKPTQIQKDGKTLSFTYGPQHMRFKQVNGSVTTFYSDKLYEEEVNGSKTTWRAYVDDIAVISQTTSESATIRYTHKDRLGSARIFTDKNGYVTSQRNFDPFGKPRLASGSLMPYGNSKLNDLDKAKTHRGFTDHEHLDDVELIHMNGRVYDYNLGRFMSVDPVIQSPTNSQSINPYSYIMNNPLSGTDPTGYESIDVSGIRPDCGGPLSCWDQPIEDQFRKQNRQSGNTSSSSNSSNGAQQQSSAQSSSVETADIGSPSTTAKGNNSTSGGLSSDQLNQIYSDTASTIGNGAAAAVGNLIPDMVNGIADWTERFLHQDSGSLGRMDQWVDVDNEIAQGVANDFRKVGSVLLANTPLRANSSASMRLPSGGLSGNMVAQPKLLWGRNAEQIAATLTAEGYQVALRQSTRGSGNATIIKVDGHKQVTQIQVHAGGGRHGGAYYKISTSTQGKVWVVNPATFRADPNQKGTIVSGVN